VFGYEASWSDISLEYQLGSSETEIESRTKTAGNQGGIIELACREIPVATG
jgi:hypothetical protein